MARLEGVHVGQRLGRWLAEPVHAERAAAAVADALRGVVEVLDDRDVQDAVGGLVERRLRATHVAPAPRQGHRRRRRGRPPPAPARQRAAQPGVVPRRQPRHVPQPPRSRSRRGGCPSRSTTASSRRSSPACSASSPTSAATPDHEVRRVDRRARPASSPSGCATDPVLIAKAEELKQELLVAPRRAGVAAVAVGRARSGRSSPTPTIPTASCAAGWPAALGRLGAATDDGSGAAGEGRRLGRAGRGLRRRELPRRGRRPHRHDGRSAGTPPTRHGASSCRSAATSSSSASTARSSAASPAWRSTPSAS